LEYAKSISLITEKVHGKNYVLFSKRFPCRLMNGIHH
jgi:hypothetical protein